MTRLALFAIVISSLLSATAARASTPAHLWSRHFGGTSTDQAYGIAVDGAGNVLVTGAFQGTADFGGGPLTGAGVDDLYIAKYASSGVHIWSKVFGSASSEQGDGIAADAAGNVVVTGSFTGTFSLGGGNLATAGGQDIFLAKYNSTGVHQWSLRFGSTGVDIGQSVAIDSNGDVVLASTFNGTVNFGGANLTSAGGTDVCLAKYNSSGIHQWSQRFGGTGTDTAGEVALDGTGNAFLVGWFNGTTNFGGVNLTSAGSNDVYVAMYNASGTHQWSQRFGSTLSDLGNGVGVDAAGSVVITGSFGGTVNFGGANLASVGSIDIFLAKYNSGGVHQWSQRFGSVSSDTGRDVDVNGSGNVYLAGFISGVADLGGGPLTAAGMNDAVAACYTSAGQHVWSGRFGAVDSDRANAIAVGPSGNPAVLGEFLSTTSFGGDLHTSNAMSQDVFVAVFGAGAAEPAITSVADIGNDQGRRVKIRFDGSGRDHSDASIPVLAYEAYRRDDAAPAPPATGSLSDRELHDAGWTFAGSVPAHGVSSYGIDVPTIGDSTVALGQYHSVFFVRATTGRPAVFHDSPPDSGYSLDNLAPGVPSSLVYNAGVLDWTDSSAEDFDYFTVYGSNTDAFGSATLVNYAVASTLDVTSSPYTFYWVTATDFSGNEGDPAKVNTLSGVGGAPRSYVLSISNHPNPFNPRTTVSYTIPSRALVTVSVYDARGARVATLVDREERDAGGYRVDWDGRTDDGPAAASGVYFARIEHNGSVRAKKMTLVK